MRTINKSYQNGFTLLELSIVLAIIGVVSGLGIVTLTASLQASQVNQTVVRMNAIEAALLNFGASFNRMPCPADLQIAAGATNYGVEAANQGSCFGGTPHATSQYPTGTSTPVEGAVPTRALKLPDSYMYDSFAHRFRYAVDPFYTTKGTLPAASGSCVTASTSAIRVNDSSGNARTTSGLYVLLSHGRNGHGAYSANGGTTMFNGGSTNTNELQNCHCTSGAGSAVTASGTTALYVEQAPTQITTGSAITGFDDIVAFKEPWQIQTPNAPLPAPPSCQVLVGNTDGTPGLELFNSSPASYVKSIASNNFAQTGGMSYIKIDANGNIWTTYEYWQGVEEDNSAGSLIMVLPTSCGHNVFFCGSGSPLLGSFNLPGGIAFSPTGPYVWIADVGNNRLEEFNTSSGTFIQAYPSTGSAGCQVSSKPACPATNYTTGTFSFNSANLIGLTFDNGGNLWVADAGNNRVEEFNASGTAIPTFIKSVPDASTCTHVGRPACTLTGTPPANGTLDNPVDVAFDSAGSMWVSEANGTRVSAFNMSGTIPAYTKQVITDTNQGYGACDKQGLYTPEQIAFDKTGSLWIADYGCDRVSQWNVSGTTASWQQIIPANCYCTGSGCYPPSCTAGDPPLTIETTGIAFPTR